MADFILHATLSNLLVSALLAVIAWIIQQRYQSAALANFLWVMVLLKMVTPPLFALPVLEVAPIAALDPPAMADAPILVELTQHASAITTTESLPAGVAQSTPEPFPWLFWLGCTWVMTSALLLALSLVRVIRFHGYLKRQLLPAPQSLVRLCHQVAQPVGIGRLPRIAITRANISPFVWWTGGRPLVVVPQSAIDGLSDDDLRMILAHELTHVKRGDHYVRWLEWLAGLALWWNPVLWIARGQLRTTEEIACDALVVQSLRPAPRDYARSLLNMAELLTTSTIRPPAVASAINSGGTLEKRLTMILKPTTLKLSTWTALTVLAMAASLFPLGLVYAQDYEAIQKRLGQAVQSGEISRAQAGTMLEALKSSRKNKQAKGAAGQQYAQAEERIKAAVEAGQVTREQAEQRLKMLAERLRRGDQQETDPDMEAKKREYMAAAEKIEGMVKQGKVLKADAEKRLGQLRMRMFPDQDQPQKGGDADMDARKQKYQELASQVNDAVKAGKTSKEDAEKKLIELRKKMFPARSPADAQKARAKQQFMDAIQRRMSTGGIGDQIDDTEAQKKRYMEGARRIEAAVEAGKLSKEVAEKRLMEMRKAMFPEAGKNLKEHDPKKPKTDADMEAKKRGYMERVRRIEAAVEAGQVSKENAEKRLIELRKAIFPEADGQEGEKANEKANSESDEKANGQRRRRLLRRNGG